jgi:hypothetical protein
MFTEPSIAIIMLNNLSWPNRLDPPEPSVPGISGKEEGGAQRHKSAAGDLS